jgi:hypothetical protein
MSNSDRNLWTDHVKHSGTLSLSALEDFARDLPITRLIDMPELFNCEHILNSQGLWCAAVELLSARFPTSTHIFLSGSVAAGNLRVPPPRREAGIFSK